MSPGSPAARAALPRWAPALLLVAATLAAHGAAIGNGFVWDDPVIFADDPATRDLSRLGTVLLSPDEVKPYYRPLNRASYLVDYQLFGLDPRGFHAVSVALHAASVLALFALARRLFASRGPALAAALLLAVHPLHVESVSFVTARNNVFTLLFALLAAVLHADALRLGSAARAWASGLAFFLALASKEQGLMVLPLLAVWPWLAGRERPALRRWAASLAPHAVALGAYLVARAIALDGLGGGGGDPGGPGLLERLAGNLDRIPRYLALALWPGPLTIFHPDRAAAPFPGAWALAWAALLAGAALLLRRSTPAARVGLAWFALNLVPILGLVPIPSAAFAERFVHVALAGLWLVAADLLARLAARLPPRAVQAAFAVVLAALAVRAGARHLDWRDDLALARSAVHVDPGSTTARLNLAVALKDAGDLASAEREWNAVLARDPRNAKALAQLGTLAAVRGDLARAEPLFRAALASDPALGMAELNLAVICERTGRPAEALARYQRFLALATDLDAELLPRARARVAALSAGAR